MHGYLFTAYSFLAFQKGFILSLKDQERRDLQSLKLKKTDAHVQDSNPLPNCYFLSYSKFSKAFIFQRYIISKTIYELYRSPLIKNQIL